MTRGEMRLHNETMAVLDNYLIRRGIPMPPGAVTDPAGASIVDEQGNVLPSEGKVLQRRPDGSVEWLLMDILVPLQGQEDKHIYIEPKAAAQPAVKHPVTVQDDGTLVTLSNGISTVVLSRTGGSLIQKLVINGKTVVDGELVDLQVVDGGGKIHRASQSGAYTITVTHQNRLRTEVTMEGKHQARDGATFLDFALRFTLTANMPDVQFDHSFYCREPREGRINVKSMKFVMPTKMDGGATKLLRQNLHGYDNFPRDVELAENVEIVAANTGNIDNYAGTFEGAKAAHPGAGGNIFIRNFDSLQEDFSELPFHMRPGQQSGFRAFNSVYFLRQVNPIIGWKDGDFTLATTFEHFRQLHPKSINIDENLITWSIWPEWSIPMEIVMGVSKSHMWWLTGEPRALEMNDVLDIQGRWEEGYVEPVDISFDPAWPAYCEVLDCHRLLKYQPEKYPLLENLIEPVPSAGNPNRHTYDRLPAIGMFHFGDNVSPDATSCSNNEDDCNVYFPLEHFLRTGHTYAWDYGKETARHYMEVDHCEWSTDPRQHGGLIPHTGQHFIGCVYSSHQWVEGILAYYYMSGDERAKKAVIGCADNHVWWAYNQTHTVCCDGREAGVPLVNMAMAYKLTGDPKYIEASKHICENFFVKWMALYGEFKYPKQGTADHPHKFITGYGDWSSFAGLFRLWESTGDLYFKDLGVKLMKQALKPGSFSLNDVRGMDFLAAYAYGIMTGDMENVIDIVRSAIPMLLRRGGHPLRRMHFLKELDERGLIDEQMVGNRAGAI
ncbi:MAG: exo-rhamnogalacturonan lyase family protein [Armatimonadota bacterium]